jgi:two-component system, NtrC family, sensor kinase
VTATDATRDQREAELVEQQAVMANILRIIASSPANVQQVLDDVASQSRRLIAADGVGIWRREGDHARRLAVSGTGEGIYAVGEVVPFGPNAPDLTGRTRHVPDMLAEHVINPNSLGASQNEAARREGRPLVRVMLAVPLLREGEPIGSIRAWRNEPHPYSDQEIALLESFADHAVIAIENARLFSELQASNKTLTQQRTQLQEALERETATGEILRIIASSPTQVQAALDAVAQRRLSVGARARRQRPHRRGRSRVHSGPCAGWALVRSSAGQCCRPAGR